MTAAITATQLGRRVIVVEKSAFVGGTAALSGGAVWVPNTHLASGHDDSYEKARRYLDAIVGDLIAPEMKDTFLTRGPEAIAFIEDNSKLKFSARAYGPDYFDGPGSALGRRLLDPAPFDGRSLGTQFTRLRPPLPEFGLFGKMMVNTADLGALLAARRSPKAFWHASKIITRYAVDRLRGYPRGTRLLIGNGMMAALYATTLDRDIPIWCNSPARRILTQDGRITGVEVEREGTFVTIPAESVILASGGFAGSEDLRARLVPEAPAPLTAGLMSNTGEGLRMAEAVGGQVDAGNSNGAFWSPVSLVRRKDGTVAHFPHLMFDRAKPGMIAVGPVGKRFVNESNSYHEFGKAMIASKVDHAFLIADSNFAARYTIGPVPPVATERRKFVRDGYLLEGRSLEDLATKAGLDPAVFSATIAQFNASARKGEDPEFGKGTSAYNRNLGDPKHTGNPCVAPIEKGPFYAVKVYLGDIGTARGLAVNTDAQVLDAEGVPIPGLYAAGNDMSSMMGGEYPGPGITLGPAITFGYLAAKHAARSNA